MWPRFTLNSLASASQMLAVQALPLFLTQSNCYKHQFSRELAGGTNWPSRLREDEGDGGDDDDTRLRISSLNRTERERWQLRRAEECDQTHSSRCDICHTGCQKRDS